VPAAVATLAAVSWWAWTLLWVVLVLAAAGFLYTAARRLLRQGAALARELGEAAELLAEVSRVLDDAGEHSPAPSPPPDPRRPSGRAPPGRPRRTAGPQDVR
jgi:hypothetical protein